MIGVGGMIDYQVERLKGENATLYKQFTDAAQQFKEANTNNRVLKSDVEVLRAKVYIISYMVPSKSISFWALFFILSKKWLMCDCKL